MENSLDIAIASQDFDKVIELCDENLIEIGEEHNKEGYLRYSIIKSVFLVNVNKLEEAKKILTNLYIEGYRTIDTEFLLSKIFYQLDDFEEALRFGSIYIEHLNENKANSLPTYTDAVNMAHEMCNNLGSISLKLNRIEDALAYFTKGLEFKDDYSILYQNLGIVYINLEKLDDAKEVLERGKEKCSDSEIHRMLGLILRSTHYYNKSFKELNTAVTLGSQEALFDLAGNYRILSKFKEAKKCMEKYLKFNPENQEARIFIDEIKENPNYGKKEPTISICMIVKDEEEMLGQCLESVVDAADEIIVVDTGSKDKTVEIAESFGAKVFHHPWNDNFSEARNHSLSYAGSDWILIIDADEVLEREDIPKLLESKWKKEYDAICYAVYSVLPGQIGGVNMGKNYSARLFKNKKSIYYEGIVHNLLRMPKKNATAEIRMYHYGYDLRPEKMGNKFKRSLSLLLKQIEEDPGDIFARYNTAQMYLSRGIFKEAEEHASKIIEICKPNDMGQQHLYLMGLYQLALIKLRKDDGKESEKCCLEALELKDDYIDPMHVLMWIYFTQERFDEAKEMCYKFMETINNTIEKGSFNLLILSKLGSNYEALYILGEISKKEGDLFTAKDYIYKSLKVNQYYWKAYRTLGKILMDEGNYKEASESLELGIKYGYLNAEKYGTLGGSQKEYSAMVEEYRTALEKSIL